MRRARESLAASDREAVLLIALWDEVRRGSNAEVVLSLWKEAVVAPIGASQRRTWNEDKFDQVPAGTPLRGVVRGIVELGDVLLEPFGSEARDAFLSLARHSLAEARTFARHVRGGLARAGTSYASFDAVVIAGALAGGDEARFELLLARLAAESANRSRLRSG